MRAILDGANGRSSIESPRLQACRWLPGILPAGAGADPSRACPEFGPRH